MQAINKVERKKSGKCSNLSSTRHFIYFIFFKSHIHSFFSPEEVAERNLILVPSCGILRSESEVHFK